MDDIYIYIYIHTSFPLRMTRFPTNGKIGKAVCGLGLEGLDRAESAESFLFAGLALERSCHLLYPKF